MDKYDFKFGTDVYSPDRRSRDKQVGRLTKVVVDPATWQITDCIVESGLLFKRATVVPIAKIEDASAHGVRLMIGKDELNDYPEFIQTTVEKGAQGWAHTPDPGQNYINPQFGSLTAVPEVAVVRERVRIGIEDNALVLDNETAVGALDYPIGKLSHLITDSETCQIRQFVVSHGAFLPQQFLIPAPVVERLSEQQITINATSAEMTEFDEATYNL